MPVYALNLFDLTGPEDYREYIKRSQDPIARLGARLVCAGMLNAAGPHVGDEPRQVMLLVEWPSHEAFEAYVADPELAELHGLREAGTDRYLWWLYDRLDDLRPLFAARR